MSDEPAQQSTETLTLRQVLLAFGANMPGLMGDPGDTLRAATKALDCDDFSVRDVSRFYRNPAFPPGSGPEFVNAVARFRTTRPPQDVLSHVHSVEDAMGRVRSDRWAARSIDIDVLCIDDLVLPDAEAVTQWIDLPPAAQRTRTPDRMILPHPRLQDRAFVLVPAAGIWPDWRHPILGLTIAEMRDELPRAAIAELRPEIGCETQ